MHLVAFKVTVRKRYAGKSTKTIPESGDAAFSARTKQTGSDDHTPENHCHQKICAVIFQMRCWTANYLPALGDAGERFMFRQLMITVNQRQSFKRLFIIA